MANPTAGPAVRAKCLECLGAETGGQAYDCASELCPLRVCQPWREKLLPIGQRPKVWVPEVKEGDVIVEEGRYAVNYDEAAEAVRLADHLARHPKRQPSGALCAAMCRECMGVGTERDLPEEQKGGGNRVSCEKQDCPLWNWQPYRPGGRPKRVMSEKQVQAASKGLRALHSAAPPEAKKGRDSAQEPTSPPVEPSGTLALAI